MRDYTTIEEKVNYLRRLWEMHEKLCPYFNPKLDEVGNYYYVEYVLGKFTVNSTIICKMPQVYFPTWEMAEYVARIMKKVENSEYLDECEKR